MANKVDEANEVSSGVSEGLGGWMGIRGRLVEGRREGEWFTLYDHPIYPNLTLPITPSIRSKTVQSPYRSIQSSRTSTPAIHPYCHSLSCIIFPSLHGVHVACELPMGYMHGVYWRVYGWYITELDIHGHTCMAYAGRDCGIHWLGRVYLTGLGESSDKLDSLDDLNKLDSIDDLFCFVGCFIICD